MFRCPPQLNKLDIREYLEKLYNLSITDVRTMNYIGVRRAISKRRPVTNPNVRKNTKGSFKKVIVTMEDDFHFPDPPQVGESGAMRGMPRGRPGKGSANSLRPKINALAKEYGVDINKSMNATKASQ